MAQFVNQQTKEGIVGGERDEEANGTFLDLKDKRSTLLSKFD